MSNTNSKHTPLPWVLNKTFHKQIQSDVVKEKVGVCYMGADAALIVKAVNSHEELVEALKDAKIQVEALNNFLLEHGTVNANTVQVLNKIDNALKNAGVTV